MTNEDKTNNTKTLREWLFPFKSPDFRKAGWLGAGLGVAVIVFGVALVIAAVYVSGLFFEDIASDEPDGAYLRSLVYFIAVILGVPFLIWRTVIASNQARTAEQGHITERYIQAVEQLGAEKTQKTEDKETTVPNIEVRIGALYTLERIAKESEDDHIPIMETICAYIRNNAGLNNQTYVDDRRNEKHGELDPDWKKPREDIQTALIILGRRDKARIEYESDYGRNRIRRVYRLDLRQTFLARADLINAVLGPVRLEEANLTGAFINEADMTGASLNRANLSGARLAGAKLIRAELEFANLTDARLQGANLTEAGLIDANLAGVSLEGANLTDARLNDANSRETGGTSPDKILKLIARIRRARDG